MTIYLAVVFVLMGFFFLFVGGRVIVSKRPLFIPARYFFAPILLGFSPQLVQAANRLSTASAINSLVLNQIIFSIIFIGLLVYAWFQLQGYMAIGVSDDSFRDALHFSLNKNNLPFEEKLSVIELTSLSATLQVAVQSWIGVAQLKLKKSKNSEILPEIIEGVNEYYSENDKKPNLITSIFYTLMGAFLLIFTVVLFTMFPRM